MMKINNQFPQIFSSPSPKLVQNSSHMGPTVGVKTSPKATPTPIIMSTGKNIIPRYTASPSSSPRSWQEKPNIPESKVRKSMIMMTSMSRKQNIKSMPNKNTRSSKSLRGSLRMQQKEVSSQLSQQSQSHSQPQQLQHPSSSFTTL